MSINILIIDDDPVAQHILRSILESEGHIVKSATTKKQAVSVIKDHTSKVELCFVDLLLPDGSGSEVINEIRALRDKEDLPIIVISANPEHELSLSTHDLAYEGYLEKPFIRETVVKAISVALDVD